MKKNKKIIINADDYGLSKSFNKGIEEAYLNGFLTSTSVRINGKMYSKEGMKLLKERCPDIGVGLHLNIVEGKTTLGKKERRYPIYKKKWTL